MTEIVKYTSPRTSFTSSSLSLNAAMAPQPSSMKSMKGVEPRNHIIIFQKLAAEFISTFILIVSGCGAMMVDEISHGKVTHVGVALTWGIAVTILIYTVGHISGCHMNPAVSIALASVRKFNWSLVPLYLIAQVAGAISGSSVLLVTLGNYAHLGATLPSGSDSQSLVFEIGLTFILMFVVMGTTTDSKSISHLGGLAIGSTIALDALFGGPISGASMNPARSLGPFVIMNMYSKLWIYMVGPLIGALAGAWGYEVIRFRELERREGWQEPLQSA